ncbi:MAG: carbohydrate kinase [Desulfobacteraceae bacterium]|nr:carbohydrate kinase [Desulfobacteraceae bacterium]MBC2756303.1 carbohydrate kinase [Desulfobacteraceae bacterium]
MEKVILSIDCGTQSLRALLYSQNGDLIERVQIKYDPYFSPKPGWAEQDSEIYWQSLCNACKSLKEKNPDAFGKIEGVGVTTIRDTWVNVDQDGNPLRTVIHWLDQRKAKKVYFPNVLIKLGLKAVGMAEVLDKIQKDSKCNWIRQNQPEIWEKTYKYMQISGFLNFKLTGQFADSVASQIGHVPFDYKKMKWSSKGELNYSLCPIEKEKLLDIVTPGELLGKITKKASELTGISEGIPVIACGSDRGCETIGMGVVNQKMANLGFGTIATVQTTSKKFFEPRRFLPPYPAPIPDHYNFEIDVYRGYWMVTWFKEEFAYKEILEAEEKGIIPEEVLNNLLGQAPAGSMGLVVQPYWGPGLKTLEAKGAMIGFGSIHKKSHVYRAVIEGLGYALLDGLKQLERAGKEKVEKVTVAGGASQSDEICQINADIFNLPLVRGKTHETSGLGAAIVTSAGLGIHSSFEAAINTMVKYDTVFEPNPQNVEVYQEIYNGIYKNMYKSLKPYYEKIRDITGYPEK